MDGSDLPRLARALWVTDLYEALTAERPYRSSHSPEDALEVLRSDAGSKLYAECVEAPCELVERRGPEPWQDAPTLSGEEGEYRSRA